jgi:hypothetical protein
LHAVSIVAYLVDVHGWPAFLRFLQSLPASEGHRQALVQAYGLEFAGLEEQWVKYFPMYFQGRWQAHAWYNYDLSQQQELVKAGAYSDAHKALSEIVPLLEKSGQSERLVQARQLMEQAGLGVEASNLIIESRQALQNGDYQHSLELVDQAEQRYVVLNNYQRLDEISGYRDQVQKILQVHLELDQLRSEASSRTNTFGLAAQLVRMGQRLAALGDVRGQTRVMEMLGVVTFRQQNQYLMVSILGITLALALLFVRISFLRRKPAVEAQL